MKIIKMLEKSYLKTTNEKKLGLISLKPKPNVPPIYLKNILGKSLN
jgi:hypothetical protein